VLTLVVEHGNLPLKSVCTLLQSSATVNAALRQACGKCRLDCTVDEDRQWGKLYCCCAWLIKHPGLVSELSVSVTARCQTDSWAVLAIALQGCAGTGTLAAWPCLHLDLVSFVGRPSVAVFECAS
jgi:hypothetical protein